jgi:NADH-quinone oxidoreductase subunit A
MNPYLPVIIIIMISLVVGLIMSALSRLLGPHKPNKLKEEAFECGVPQTPSEDRISIKFYMTAILFILFDIETIFLYLWARAFNFLGWFGFFEIIIFMVILIIGYLYILNCRALEWD